MRLLLDTHIALWALTDDAKLSAKARQLLSATENEIFVSAASLWEISIKHALARGEMPVSGEAALEYLRDAGVQILPITAEHAVAVERLPALHDDPFDRLLLAQAVTEPLYLVTHDRQIERYEAPVIMV
jgi:PIN domain nuclease of toxin-antitoxin system